MTLDEEVPCDRYRLLIEGREVHVVLFTPEGEITLTFTKEDAIMMGADLIGAAWSIGHEQERNDG